MSIYDYMINNLPSGWEEIFMKCDLEILHASNRVIDEADYTKLTV